MLPFPFYETFSATHLPAQRAARTTTRPGKSRSCMSFQRRKQHLPLADIDFLTPLTIYGSVVRIAAHISCAIYPPTVYTEQMSSEKSVQSHFSTSFHRWKQRLPLTNLVRPTLLTVSRSVVPTAAHGSSATFLLTLQTERVGSNKVVRSHFDTLSLIKKK